MPEYTANSHHPEVPGPLPGQPIGIWVSAIMDPNLLNFRVVTRGYPVEIAPIQAYFTMTVGTGTGQTMKSFIRK